MVKAKPNIIVDIQVITDLGEHFVRVMFDGHEIDRYGPYPTLDLAMEAGKLAANVAKPFVKSA